MGLLAPLYALAALAIVGPIVFHLIKRQPKGHKQFSSLMFLRPSPPSLTRRSRLDNLLLLFLRSLVILLLAFAFARPYLRQESFEASAVSGQQVVLVLDTSASMQRTDVWAEALRVSTEVLDSLSAADRVALFTIDERSHSVISLESLASVDNDDSRQLVRDELRELTPTWKSTQLSAGLRAIADELAAISIGAQATDSIPQNIVLISDLHQDCGLEGLQGYEWPEGITLDIRQVLPKNSGNARVNLVPPGEDEDSGKVRVRVENTASATQVVFPLSWLDADGEVISATNIQVPPGQTRVVSMGKAPRGAMRVGLTGDTWDADNEAYLVNAQDVLERVVFFRDPEDPRREDVDRLEYFLQRVPLDVGPLKRSFDIATPEMALGVFADPKTVAVFTEVHRQGPVEASLLRQFAEAGGTVVLCLAEPLDSDVSQTETQAYVGELLGNDAVTVVEAPTRDFSLLSKVDYKHPLFEPFADPRFNDFSKLRFWSHRCIGGLGGLEPIVDSATEPGRATPGSVDDARLRVVARLDDGFPLLIEKSIGSGRIWVFSAGWQPAGSGLALSSKFVPIITGIVAPANGSEQWKSTYEVGELIPADAQTTVRLGGDRTQAEYATQVEHAAGGVRLLEPGLYVLASGDSQREVAVVVPQSESRLDPLDPEVVEQLGAEVGTLESDAVRRASEMQLKVEQLEDRQRLWQWLIALGIAVLAVESFVAALRSRPGGIAPPVEVS